MIKRIACLVLIMQSCNVNCIEDLVDEYNLGNYEKVIELADDCNESYRNDDIYIIKANSYFELGRYFEAKRELARFMVADIINIKVAEMYHACDIYLNKNEDARASFIELINIDSTKPSLYYRLGQANSNLSLYKEAIDAFSKAIFLDSSNVGAISGRGLAFQKSKQYKESINDFTKALDILPQSYILFYNRGVSYGFLKEYSSALGDFGKSIMLNDSFSQVYIDQGILFHEMGKIEDACSNFEKAKSLSNSNAQTYIDDLCK